MNTAKAIALCCFSAATLFLFSDRSVAQESCRVADPTNTPLNVRTEPNGRVIATLRNGDAVSILNRSIDQRGRNWVYLREIGQSAPLGWAFSDFIRCSSTEFTPVENLYRAWRTLDINLYAAQWAPNAYKIDHKRGVKIESARLFVERENLFSQIATADAEYTPVLENSNGDEALIRVSYSLKITYKSGRGFTQKDCETYRVRKFENRWLIVVNDDYLPCGSVAPTANRNDQSSQSVAQQCQQLSGDAAVSVCSDAIIQNPKNVALYLSRGKAYFGKGLYERASADFKEVLRLDPENKEAAAYIKVAGDNKYLPEEKSERVDLSLLYFFLALASLFTIAFLFRLIRTRANGAAYSPPANAPLSERLVRSTKQTVIKSSALSPTASEAALASDAKNNSPDVRVSVGASKARSTAQEHRKPNRSQSAKSSGVSVKGAGSAISNKVFLLVVGVLILCSVVFAYVITPRDDCAWLENLDQDRLKQRIALLPLDRRFEVGQKIMMLGYGELGEALDSTRKRMEALERGEQYERKNLSFEETKKLACARVREIVEPIYNWR